MPSTSKSQQRLFCMALAVRKGDLARSKVNKSVLDIVDGDMTNKQIEDFTVLKEMSNLGDYLKESIKGSVGIGKITLIKSWLKDQSIPESYYEINPDDTITFNRSIAFSTEIPDYVTISYAADCFTLNNVKSLKNCPKKVGRFFRAAHCELDSLEGMPEEILGTCVINDCSIKSLKGLTKSVGKTLYIGNNKQHFEKSEVEKYTDAKDIKVFGYIAPESYCDGFLGDNDMKFIESQIDYDKYKKESSAKDILIYKSRIATDIFVRFEYLKSGDIPYSISDNGIYISFIYNVNSGVLEYKSQGHLELTEEDKKGKYKYYALKGFMDPYIDRGGKKFRKCKAKDIKDAFKRMIEWVKPVYKAALEDQNGKLTRKQ